MLARLGLATLWAATAALALAACSGGEGANGNEARADAAAIGERAAQLREACASATSLKVMPYQETEQDSLWNESAAVEITDVDAVQELVALLRFDAAESGGMCACLGSDRLVFRGGERVLADVTFHYYESLRWQDGTWVGDSIMQPESVTAFRAWFKEHGYDVYVEGRYRWKPDRPASNAHD